MATTISPVLRGKLTIFLGYASGVGKTYAMLEAARQRLSDAADVVLALAGQNDFPETHKQMAGFETIEPVINADGQAALDMERILARKPQILVVDTLAADNPPGARHPKRYLDVEELLLAGVDVYTTLNISEIESLTDIVEQITAVHVRETVPDRILDEAHDIKLVDLPVDELLQRLANEKIILSGQPAQFSKQFYRKGNLTALREMALRRAAVRVDTQMRSYMFDRAIPGPWPAADRILVSLSAHPLGERLIRAGRKLADDLHADWFVLFVETPGHLRMPEENRERIRQNLWLAEKLGARVYRVSGRSAADEIINFSRQHNITKIVAGKPLRPRWKEFIYGSVIDEIIRKSGSMNVYVVSEHEELPRRVKLESWLPLRPLFRYLGSQALVALGTIICLVLSPYIAPANLVMIYLAAVVVIAVLWGRGPAMLSSLTSALAFDFFLVDPKISLVVSDTQYIITFGGLLLVGLIISNSAALVRNQVDVMRRREGEARLLNQFSQELAGAIPLDQVLAIVVRNIHELFDRETVILLPEKGGLTPVSATLEYKMLDEEYEVANWSFQNGQQAGRGTETMSGASAFYVPLKTAKGVVGILGIKPLDPKELLTAGQRQLLNGFVNFSALAIERAKFAEEALQAEKLRSTERLPTALLNSISHQLRTPLSIIKGVLTSLGVSEKAVDENNHFDPRTRLDLIDSAINQANILNRLVENLLNMTRLEAGAVKLNQQICDFQDVVGAVLGQMAAQLGSRKVGVNISADLPVLWIDPVLTGQVMVNVLENACKYSPDNSPLQISAWVLENRWVEISVKDQGSGVPAEELERVFEKFYRSEGQSKVPGSGLGLSICRGLIEAQGGKIWMANNPDCGVTVTFTLPVFRPDMEEAFDA